MRTGPRANPIALDHLGAFSLIIPKAKKIFDKYRPEPWGDAELVFILEFMLLPQLKLIELSESESAQWARMFLERPSAMIKLLGKLERELSKITQHPGQLLLLIFLLRNELGDSEFCNRFLKDEKAGEFTDVLRDWGIGKITTSTINHVRESIKALSKSSPKPL